MQRSQSIVKNFFNINKNFLSTATAQQAKQKKPTQVEPQLQAQQSAQNLKQQNKSTPKIIKPLELHDFFNLKSLPNLEQLFK